MAAIVWSIDAIADLEAVGTRLATSSSSFAGIYLKRLVRAVDGLATLPSMGRKVRELDREDVREVVYQNYRLPYHVQAGQVTILGVQFMPVDLQTALEPRVLGQP